MLENIINQIVMNLSDTRVALVIVVFVSQIVTLSIYLPGRWLRYRKALFERYPAEEYPNLYYQPESVEILRQKIRQGLDWLVASVGIGLIMVALTGEITAIELAVTMITFAPVQIFPFFLSRYWGYKNQLLMKKSEGKKIRKASLATRKVKDFIPLYLVLLAISMYLLTLIVGIWSELNGETLLTMIGLNTIITIYSIYLMNKALNAAKDDQFLSAKDRLAQIGKRIRKSIILSILFSSFILSILVVTYFGLGKEIFLIAASIYFQLIFVIEVNPKIERDFSVYKAGS